MVTSKKNRRGKNYRSFQEYRRAFFPSTRSSSQESGQSGFRVSGLGEILGKLDLRMSSRQIDSPAK
jgi:hypothetical protein